MHDIAFMSPARRELALYGELFVTQGQVVVIIDPIFAIRLQLLCGRIDVPPTLANQILEQCR